MGQRAATEHLAQLVGPAGPGIADDVHGVWSGPSRVRPVQQEARHRGVEELIGRRRRPDQVVIDPAMGDGLARREVSLLAPPDEQHVLRMRMDAPHLTQQLGAGSAREPLPARIRATLLGGGEVLEVGQSHIRAHTDDAVVARVTVTQLMLDVA